MSEKDACRVCGEEVVHANLIPLEISLTITRKPEGKGADYRTGIFHTMACAKCWGSASYKALVNSVRA